MSSLGITSAAVSPAPKESQPIMQLAELAAFFGVVKRTAWRYSLRDDFPPVFATLTTGKVWQRSAVEKWADKHLPFPLGRPPAKGRKRNGTAS